MIERKVKWNWEWTGIERAARPVSVEGLDVRQRNRGYFNASAKK